jgi:hypothetical protein
VKYLARLRRLRERLGTESKGFSFGMSREGESVDEAAARLRAEGHDGNPLVIVGAAALPPGWTPHPEQAGMLGTATPGPIVRA